MKGARCRVQDLGWKVWGVGCGGRFRVDNHEEHEEGGAEVVVAVSRVWRTQL